MKKAWTMLMALTLLFALTACAGNAENGEPSATQPLSTPLATATGEPNPNDVAEPAETDAKALVVYFSWSGNTEHVAQSIQSQTGADLFEIVPATPYSEDYDTVVDLAQEEQQQDARPAIAGGVDDIAQYDVIYVGYPNWWGDMPMILYTFFDTYDLSGKTIAPFCTSGGSGLSHTVQAIQDLEPNATVTDGLHIGSGASSNPDEAVRQWLNATGLAR